MKKILFSFLFLPVFLFSQDTEYTITSFLNQDLAPEKKAPNLHYLGSAWLTRLVEADSSFDYNLTQATFSPNSTLDWHKHSTGQVLIVVEGKGYYQERGKAVVVVQKGDVITCAKNIEHWHSSTPEHLVSYIAIYGNSETLWTEKLKREDYNRSKGN